MRDLILGITGCAVGIASLGFMFGNAVHKDCTNLETPKQIVLAWQWPAADTARLCKTLGYRGVQLDYARSK